MPNIIQLEALLRKDVIHLLDKNAVITPWANRKYEGTLREHGDTVSVQTFPRLRGNRSALAGEDIPNKDWAITKHQFTVAQIVNDSRKIKDIESLRSNLDLRGNIAREYAYAITQAHENHVAVRAALGANAINRINENAPVALSPSNIYANIEKMRVRHSEENVFSETALFVDAHTMSQMRQSPLFDGYVEGLIARKGSLIPGFNGMGGEMSKYIVYETNNLPFRQSLTLAANPTIGDTFALNMFDVESKLNVVASITFVASATNPGEVTIGATTAATQANLISLFANDGAATYVDVSAAARVMLKEYEVSLSAFALNVAQITANRKILIDTVTLTAAGNLLGTASKVIFACDHEAINFVDQLTGLKINPPSSNGGFYALSQYESVFQGGVLGNNDLRIVTFDAQYV